MRIFFTFRITCRIRIRPCRGRTAPRSLLPLPHSPATRMPSGRPQDARFPAWNWRRTRRRNLTGRSPFLLPSFRHAVSHRPCKSHFSFRTGRKPEETILFPPALSVKFIWIPAFWNWKRPAARSAPFLLPTSVSWNCWPGPCLLSCRGARHHSSVYCQNSSARRPIISFPPA